METLTDIIIPSFVNAHLFWVIQKKDILLRSAMNKVMKMKRGRPLTSGNISEKEMVAINIDDLWARGIIENIIRAHEEVKYVCWLPDYGIMRSVVYVFPLPEGLEKCPCLAKQASLHNVVNLTTELVLGNNGYELQLRKTTAEIEGVRKVALDNIETAYKIDFCVSGEDTLSLYGDIIFLGEDNTQRSLTEILKNIDLVDVDEKMFASIENKRFHFKKSFYQNSANWQQELDRTLRKHLPKIVFNRDKNPTMEFFERKRNNNGND